MALTETGASKAIDVGLLVEEMIGILSGSGMQATTNRTGSGSTLVIGENLESGVSYHYKIRPDGAVKGPNPKKYERIGKKAHEAAVLNIRDILAVHGLNDYNPHKRTYFHNPDKL